MNRERFVDVMMQVNELVDNGLQPGITPAESARQLAHAQIELLVKIYSELVDIRNKLGE